MLPAISPIAASTSKSSTQHGGTEDTEDTEKRSKKNDVIELSGNLAVLAATVDHPAKKSHRIFSVSSVPSVPPCWVESVD